MGSCIEQLQLRFRRITGGQPWKPNCAFYLVFNGEKIRRCKPFIIQTLGITEGTLRKVIASRASGTEIVDEDTGGKYKKHRKTDKEVLFDTIPKVESHYVRNDRGREFIDGKVLTNYIDIIAVKSLLLRNLLRPTILMLEY